MTINTTLNGGSLNLVGSVDTYQLVLPSNVNTALPYALDNQVISECYLICDTSNEDVIINLPPISVFSGSWAVKLYITNVGNGQVVINQGAPSDLINDLTTWVNATTNKTCQLTVSNYNLWCCIESTIS